MCKTRACSEDLYGMNPGRSSGTWDVTRYLFHGNVPGERQAKSLCNSERSGITTVSFLTNVKHPWVYWILKRGARKYFEDYNLFGLLDQYNILTCGTGNFELWHCVSSAVSTTFPNLSSSTYLN
ncbi:hypothetical protein CISG_07453 [Coccidioides immitis RMSCC 3703]|uniref:Uncharacterized protein n=2 Tax=Coccidioides immitis TaxID=5501 RepID=A0A0J8QZW8_COCIT|nr:hypothetical protein CIRG_09627 [Coccidioides immitis RMSCC 2394]KMU78449.1 hypothetical protein CISG_07453 [Coccidioides immitis RMSCC 3703]